MMSERGQTWLHTMLLRWLTLCRNLGLYNLGKVLTALAYMKLYEYERDTTTNSSLEVG